jgi:hypothetical protein
MPVGPNDPASAYPPAPGGSSSAGLPCWFETTGTYTASTSTDPSWVALSDGVAPFTDARVASGDSTLIEIVTAGTYLLNAEAMCTNETETPTEANMTLALNADEIGPLYGLTSHVYIVPGAYITLRVACPVQLAAGDVIKATIASGGVVEVRLATGLFMLLRVA